jgi:hypothetical protein
MAWPGSKPFAGSWGVCMRVRFSVGWGDWLSFLGACPALVWRQPGRVRAGSKNLEYAPLKAHGRYYPYIFGRRMYCDMLKAIRFLKIPRQAAARPHMSNRCFDACLKASRLAILQPPRRHPKYPRERGSRAPANSQPPRRAGPLPPPGKNAEAQAPPAPATGQIRGKTRARFKRSMAARQPQALRAAR